MKQKIIEKTKITWLIADTSITAFDNLQATMYSVYGSSDKESFENMKVLVECSTPEEYNNWVDIIELAQKMGVIGYGTRRPKI